MKKVHTRTKRKFGLSTHIRHYCFFHQKARKHRPKTFSTEESANLWASLHGLKPEQYYLQRVKHNKRFRIVVE